MMPFKPVDTHGAGPPIYVKEEAKLDPATVEACAKVAETFPPDVATRHAIASAIRSLTLSSSPVSEEELAKTFECADEQDWAYLISLIPDSGRGRFWKDRLSALRALLSQFSIGRK